MKCTSAGGYTIFFPTLNGSITARRGSTNDIWRISVAVTISGMFRWDPCTLIAWSSRKPRLSNSNPATARSNLPSTTIWIQRSLRTVSHWNFPYLKRPRLWSYRAASPSLNEPKDSPIDRSLEYRMLSPRPRIVIYYGAPQYDRADQNYPIGRSNEEL